MLNWDRVSTSSCPWIFSNCCLVSACVSACVSVAPVLFISAPLWCGLLPLRPPAPPSSPSPPLARSLDSTPDWTGGLSLSLCPPPAGRLTRQLLLIVLSAFWLTVARLFSSLWTSTRMGIGLLTPGSAVWSHTRALVNISIQFHKQN